MVGLFLISVINALSGVNIHLFTYLQEKPNNTIDEKHGPTEPTVVCQLGDFCEGRAYIGTIPIWLPLSDKWYRMENILPVVDTVFSLQSVMIHRMATKAEMYEKWCALRANPSVAISSVVGCHALLEIGTTINE